MVTVKRANVILEVEDDEVEKYNEKGYSVLDKYGNVIKAGAPKEMGALQKALQDSEAEVAMLTQEVERLKAENESLIKAFSNPPAEKKTSNKKKTE